MKSVIFNWRREIGALAVVCALSLSLNFFRAPAFIVAAQGAPKLTAADGAAGDFFGAQVALSGETLLVGASGARVSGQPAQGAAYVYVRSGSTWTLQQKLTAADGAANDNFGWAVALQGDTAVIGAISHDVANNADHGAAYVFTRSGSTWTLQQKLTASDGAAGNVFGWSVAVNGQTALIGALSNNGAQRNQGAAYVFTRSGSTWTQQQKLLASDGAANDAFGTSVALSGETALVGAVDKDNSGAVLQGAAYVFTRSGSTWTQQQKLLASDGAANDNFGGSVALSNDLALVGAASDQTGNNAAQGAAYVFARSGTTWTQQAKLNASDAAALDNFGAAVALNGEQALIGAPGGNGVQGAAYVFARAGITWSQQARLVASDAAAGDAFGNAVALDNGRALAGAFSDDVGANTDQGSAYLFELCPVISLTPATLNITTVGRPVSVNLSATGGTAPHSFAVSNGALPDGLALSTTGALTGTPTRAGSFAFTVRVTATGGCFSEQSYAVTLACNPIVVTPANLAAVTIGSVFPVTTLMASGGTAPYSFGFASGTLPTGMTLTSAGALSGIPTQAGTFNVVVRATDVNGCQGTQAYALMVTCPTVTLTPATLPDGTVGTAYSQSLTASGGTGPYNFSLSVGTLPTGLTLTTNGTLSGTPTQAGSHALTIKVTDANGCFGTQSYTLVLTCPTVTVGPASVPGATVGTTYGQTFTVTGGKAPHSFSVVAGGSLPTGLTLSAAGVLSGTPTTAGTFNFTVRATDANGCAGTQAYTVVATCPAISVSPATLAGGTVGQPFPQTFTATGSSNYSFSVSAGALPTGLTLAANGTLSGTLTAAGTFNFTIRATDANGCTGTQAYTVTATCPTITVGPATLGPATVGTAFSQVFSQTGGGGTVTFSLLGTLPTGLSFNAGTATLSGTATQAGSFALTLKATDANGCVGMQAYSLMVTCPTLTVNPATLPNGTAGTAYSQTLTASGGTAPYSFSVSSGTLPTGLTLANTGELSGTPTQSGPFNFTVRATDANGCTGTRDYTLTLTCPTLTVGPATLPTAIFKRPFANTPLSASGGVGTYSFTVSAGALPTGMNLTNGTLGGTPMQLGTFSFTITATDAAGCTGTLNYSLSVRRLTKGDFDGDGKTDLGIWRGANGQWQVVQSSNSQTQAIAWGRSTAPYFDVIVPGDYDGDGRVDQAIWRGADSIWYIRQSSDGQAMLQLWGTSNAPFNDIPVPGDYDGDGKTDLAVFRPLDGKWYVMQSSDNTIVAEAWGVAGDTPVPADYDGDGKTDLAVWRGADGKWFIKRSAGGVDVIPWGAGYAPYFDVPVPADYDGDGKADLAIWRGQDSIWYVRKSSDEQPILQLWGTSNAPHFDIPTPGDYDGDGKTDFAVWRPANGTWYVMRSSNGSFFVQAHGQNGDTPVPTHGIR